MPNWRQILVRLASSAEGRVDTLKRRLDERWGDEPIHIAVYRGYGTADCLFLTGRVLEEPSIRPASAADSAWRNLRNMYRRFESDVIPGARVLATFGGAAQEVVADEEGFFGARLTPGTALPHDRLWHTVELALLEPQPHKRSVVRATGQVLVPPRTARFGVISDVDDTVLQTDATRLLRMLRATFLHNARTRLPFPGVAALYRALQCGTGGAPHNPLFYVSSSPWNIYDMLDEFFAIQGIPAGPLLLRDWGLSLRGPLSPLRHRQHKLDTIRQILDTYPALPFLLIGDSGQEDPEIYREIVHLYPNRIPAIYIRNVSRGAGRIAAIQALAEEVAAAGSALILADDSLAAARHAAERGWISPQGLAEVEAAARPTSPADEQARTIAVEGARAVNEGAVAAALEAGPPEEPPPTVIVEGNAKRQT